MITLAPMRNCPLGREVGLTVGGNVVLIASVPGHCLPFHF